MNLSVFGSKALTLWLVAIGIGVCCMPAARANAGEETRAVTYDISSSTGDDSNDGKSPESPWKTIGRVNTAQLKPGDCVLFRRGDVWRGQLIPVSGDPSGSVTYSAYGKGAKPRLCGSVDRSYKADWHSTADNIWETGSIPCDVGNIIFDEGKTVGIKVWNRADVNGPDKFWYDKSGSVLMIYSEDNPAKKHRSIEVALTKNIIDESNRHHVTYQDLDLRYSGAHGIGGGNTSHIIVKNCDLSFIGGGFLLLPGYSNLVRYGNGVEFWQNAHDNLVDGCRFWEIYDTALSNQGFEKNTQTNIRYINNIIWDCEFAFECWDRPEDSVMENIYFENNTCINSGSGWSHTQRPDPGGRHLLFYENPSKSRSVYIRNNIFYQQIHHDSEWCFVLCNDWSANLIVDHNCWYQPSGPMIVWPSNKWTMAEFANYQAKTGKDAHSIASDPLFVDIDKHDFRPAANSPVRHLTAEKSYAGALPCAEESK